VCCVCGGVFVCRCTPCGVAPDVYVCVCACVGCACLSYNPCRGTGATVVVVTSLVRGDRNLIHGDVSLSPVVFDALVSCWLSEGGH
jgi:hypothetical protein